MHAIATLPRQQTTLATKTIKDNRDELVATKKHQNRIPLLRPPSTTTLDSAMSQNKVLIQPVPFRRRPPNLLRNRTNPTLPPSITPTPHPRFTPTVAPLLLEAAVSGGQAGLPRAAEARDDGSAGVDG